MSANTFITEGGKPRPFGPVKALMVQGEDGKYYPWYPEEDRALDSLSVEKNGIYRASDRGVYGWNRVYVNVPTNEGVTGRDPDTGEEVYVHPDPEGELVKDVLAVEIRVTTPPTKTEYIDGEIIITDGMVVKAYDALGNEMYIVPIGEITLNPKTAIYNSSADVPAGGTSTLDGESISYISASDYVAPQFPGTSAIATKYSMEGATDIRAYRTPTNNVITNVISKTSFDVVEYITDRDQQTQRIVRRSADSGTTIYGTTFYCSRWNPVTTDSYPYFKPSAPMAGENYTYEEAAAIFYDGETKPTPAGSPQTITVSWPRPGDGATLETTFNITVTGGD